MEVMSAIRLDYGGIAASLAGKIANMKVLVADKLEQSAIDGLKALGVDLISEPDLKDETLRDRLHGLRPEVLIVRGTKVTGEMILNSGLKLIIRAGAGYNTIDVKTASEVGVKVTNCPGKNALAVAELAFGLMIALDRYIPDNVNTLRQNVWNKKEFSKAKGLAGQTLGLVGLGNIGKAMSQRARAFEMPIIAYSLHTSPEEAAEDGIELVSLEELAQRSDIVSLHCSLSDRTKNLIGKDFLDRMKPGAMLINTARAEVVDQAALLEACRTKGIRAGLDVFDDEPTTPEGTYSGPLCEANNVYCTHHIGASTNQAQEAVASETVRIVQTYMETGTAINAVN